MELRPPRRRVASARAARRPQHQFGRSRRPHLPEHPAVPRHDGARELDGGAAPGAEPRLGSHLRRAARLPSFARAEKQAVDYARHWLDRVGITRRADEAAGSLPYGDQRRLEIARAMCTRPLLLCLDEPAAGLNARESDGLNELLFSIRKQEGIALLLIEHDMSVVMRISDHVVVLDYGKRIADGTADEARNDPARHRRLSRRSRRGTAAGRTRGARMSEPLLEMRKVTSCYGVLPILHGVSLDIQQGEIVALIGGNGAGKTTLMMTIFGRPRASDGRILFEGHDITDLPTHEVARLGIVQSPEGRRIFSRMTVLENLQMGAIVANDPANFAKDLDHVYTLFPLLKARQYQRGGTLSGGEQQMLAIGRALMGRPRLLLLDEPSLGLGAADREADLRGDPCAQRRLRPDRVPRRAERLSCAQARPSRLCHGQWQDHHERHGRRTARQPRGAGGLSRGRRAERFASRGAANELALRRRPSRLPGADRDARRRRRVSRRARAWREAGSRSGACSSIWLLLAAAVRFFHYALFDGELSVALLLSRHLCLCCLPPPCSASAPCAPRKWSRNIAGSMSAPARSTWRDRRA